MAAAEQADEGDEGSGGNSKLPEEALQGRRSTVTLYLSYSVR